MIKFDKVYLKYVNDFYSLYDCNAEIKSNSILVEKNLCGATSFMRLVSKIDKSYQGEIYIDNSNLKDLKDKELNVVYLPENPVLFKHKSIYYNLSFPLKIRKINKNLIKNQINSLILEYNLNYFNKKIKSLNIYEQKIIALLRTLIRKPKYILIENLFENLEENQSEVIINILNKLKENSIIIVSEKDLTNFKYFEGFEKVDI